MTHAPGSSLRGKVALVTGAGSGIGRATALLLAEREARVGLVGLNAEALGEVASAMDDRGLALKADISDDTQIREACRRLVERFGTIDCVFANAGINGVWAPIENWTGWNGNARSTST